MNCPLEQNTVLEIHRRGWEKCLLCLTPLFVSSKSTPHTVVPKIKMISMPNMLVNYLLDLQEILSNAHFLCVAVHSSCSDSSSVGSQKEGGSPASGRDPRRSSGSTSYSQVGALRNPMKKTLSRNDTSLWLNVDLWGYKGTLGVFICCERFIIQETMTVAFYHHIFWPVQSSSSPWIIIKWT